MTVMIRKLIEQDMEAVILLLKNNLSSFAPPKEDYTSIWNKFSKQENVISIVALKPTDNIIGYGSLIIEQKIRGGKVAHVEDIVCDLKYRRIGVGSAMLNALKSIAIEAGCYQAKLTCNDENISFYKKIGYSIKENSMVMHLGIDSDNIRII